MKLYWSGLGVAIIINCNQKIKVGQHNPPPLPKKTKTNKQEKIMRLTLVLRKDNTYLFTSGIHRLVVSTSQLKEQTAGRYAASFGHFILIPSHVAR